MTHRRRDRDREPREPPLERRRPLLVDDAERTLRDWLAPAGRRPGDRLPPEHELAGMLGISRGTLRAALGRLEQTGEIVRRQGSGTFVGRRPESRTLREGLEKLVSYSRLARRRGVQLGVLDLTIAEQPIGAEAGNVLGLPADARAPTIRRIVLADGDRVGVMRDVVHPDVPLPAPERLRSALERGDMVMDVLLAEAVPVAFARTRVIPRTASPRDVVGRALGLTRTTAVLELEEAMYVTSGMVVQYSSDIFGPGGVDLRIVRSLAFEPRPVRSPERENAPS